MNTTGGKGNKGNLNVNMSVDELADLLDLAVVQALGRGASVYVVDSPQMPERAPVAAIFRY